ncbi:VanZ family protein [Microbacterium sp. lyk4-40-TSB-66]|uniref:VanZ family protein n=1 Tax=Microbacterium sp. lyk4-40-TSB-66 TaxID=3040294 RepID=UPI0033068B50
MLSVPHHSGDRRTVRTVGRLGIVAAAIYLVLLAVILLSPTHLDRDADLVFRLAFRLFPSANGREVDFGLNVLLFLPFGGLLAPLLPRHAWAVLVIAWGVPTLVEIAQGLLLPARVSSIFDVVANAAGSLTGVLLVAGLRRRLNP